MARRRQQKGSAGRPPAASVAQPRRRRGRAALAAFLAAVFLIKLVVLLQLQDHPLLQPDGGLDAAEYVRLAHRVLDGDVWLGPGLYYLSPLYIYFLTAALAVSGSLTFVRVVQIALGTAAVGLVFLTARAWVNQRAAWCAAALAALTGVFTFYEIVLFQSSLDTFLTALALWLLSGPAPRVLPAGVVLGIQILNRPNVLLAAAGVALVMIARRQIRPALLLIAGILIGLAPVVARNAIVSRQFALGSSHGGLNFYIGNNAQATGQYAAVPGVRANIAGQAEDTRRVAEAAVGHALTDGEVSRYFSGLATAWIREHPVAAARLFIRKLALTFNARHQWLDFSYPYYAHDAGSILGVLFAGAWLLVPLGGMGGSTGSGGSQGSMGSRGSEGPIGSGVGVLWGFIVGYAVSVAVFFVAERYRLPLLVALCIPSGAAIEWLLGGWRRASRSRIVAAAAAGAAGVIVTAWPFAVPDGRFEERLRLSKVLMNRGDYGGATLELERAYALQPSDAGTEFNLGMAMVTSGRASEGIAHVKHAVDAGVPIDGARYALVSAMLTAGDGDGAIALLRSYYPAPSDTAESCFQVARLALGAGAPRVAERYVLRALELRPGWPEAQALLEQIPR